jgi:hypothetical protein
MRMILQQFNTESKNFEMRHFGGQRLRVFEIELI